MTALVEKVIAYMRDKQLGEASGHDWWHTKRVYEMAMKLCDLNGGEIDRETVALGALLHDIEDWKFNDGDETAGPRAARALLESFGAPEAQISHIETIIIDLSFKGGGKEIGMPTIEGEIVQDADRLDAVGAIGIARCFATGAVFKNELFNPETPARVKISKEEYGEKKGTSINHFYEKLFKLKNLYNTDAARKIGLERHEYLKAFVREFLIDCNAQDTQQFKLLDEM